MDKRGVQQISSIVRETLENKTKKEISVSLELIIEIYEITLLAAFDGETESGQRYAAQQYRIRHKE